MSLLKMKKALLESPTFASTTTPLSSHHLSVSVFRRISDCIRVLWVSTGTELIFFLISGTMLYFEFIVRMLLIAQ